MKAAAHVDEILTLLLPSAMMMLMFLSVMSTSPQLLNSTIEEKMSRISEVLIGSVTPFELMMGKLVGSATVSLLLAGLYLAGGLLVANHWGYGDAITPAALGWFLFSRPRPLHLRLGVHRHRRCVQRPEGCAEHDDARHAPADAASADVVLRRTVAGQHDVVDAIDDSDGGAVPDAHAHRGSPRAADVAGPDVGLDHRVTVVAAVYAAGRIFRTGLLMQGKAATVAEMWRWVRNA